MGESGTDNGHAAARAMLDIFASVGAARFDLTWTNRAGDKEYFRRGMSLAALRSAMPEMLDGAAANQRNVIVRPDGDGVTFIQLDDLKAPALPRVAPAVFLILETSPGNFQAWLAMHGQQDDDFIRRVKRGTGADKTASGATRIAGSLNFKDKYAPGFPRVAIHAAEPGRIATADQLHQLGLVAASETVSAQPLRTAPALSRRPGPDRRKWPSYERCLEGAPPSQSRQGKPRESIADFTWCVIAASWEWPVEDIARQLLEISAKAKENGQAYALKTAQRAAEAAARNAERRQQQPKRTRNFG
jgi:hypothetical protein